METLRELLETGEMTSVIDSVYPLDEIAGALRQHWAKDTRAGRRHRITPSGTRA